MKNLFVFVWISAILLGSSVKAFSNDATVLQVEGDVKIQAPDSGELTPVAGGASVPEGSLVVTSPDASCTLGFEGSLDGSALMLQSGSSAKLKNLGDSALVKREQGSVLTKLAKLKNNTQFAVSTPTALAAARGTGWRQTMDRIEVFEGVVSLKNPSSGEEIGVPQGAVYEIGPGGSFTQSASTSAADLISWTGFVQAAQTSPFLRKISARDILQIRETIDAKRQSAACGSAGAYSWSAPVLSNTPISLTLFNELKKALSEAPFAQTPEYVAAYLDPIKTLKMGDQIRSSNIKLLSDAAQNASC